MCYAKDIKMLYTFLDIINKDISKLDKVRISIYQEEQNKIKILKKHSGIQFILFSLLFSVLSYIVLNLIYVFIPKDFNYTYLFPFFGILIEFILRIKYIKQERDPVLKGVNSTIKKYKENEKEIMDDIIKVEALAEKEKRKITDPKNKKYLNNLIFLEYLLDNAYSDETALNFDKLYAEFECKVNKMDSFPDLKDLKEKIQLSQTESRYAELTISKYKENLNSEKDNNPVHNKERKRSVFSELFRIRKN